MNPAISIKKGRDFVHSHTSGPLTWELLDELITKTADMAEKWGFNKHVVDLRAGEKKLSVLEDYQLATRNDRESGLKPDSRYAVIVKHKDIGEFHHVETFFRNAGYYLRIFTEENAALDWIRE